MKRKQMWKEVLAEKGYYLAFSVCLVAVAVSGWLFVRSLTAPEEGPAAPEAVEAAVLPTLPRSEVPGGSAAVRPQAPTLPEATEAPAPTRDDPEDKAVQALPERVQPLDGPVVLGYSVDKLAYNPTTRDWRTHAGLDIAAPEGSEVRAVAEGTVVGVFADDLLGQTVTVEHAGGYVTHYANLAETVAVRAGDKVEAGQSLGTVGKTALGEVGSEAHLHFAVYKNNVPQDPVAFLAG